MLNRFIIYMNKNCLFVNLTYIEISLNEKLKFIIYKKIIFI